MPRRPNTKPTNIYWLYDMRPETIAMGWTYGYPFYCGKTVKSLKQRLSGHRKTARSNDQPVCHWVRACGDHLSIKLLRVVPLDQSWRDVERYWIKTLRSLVPNCANVNDGGEGMPGYVHTAETRALIKALHLGSKRSPETGARIAAARTGTKHTDATKAILSARMIGNKIACGRNLKKSKKELRAIHAKKLRRLKAAKLSINN